MSADGIQTTASLRHRNSRQWRLAQTRESASDFTGLTRDFQQLSSLYIIMCFCTEDWLECSGTTVSKPLMMKLEVSLTVLLRSSILTACGQWYRKTICGRLGRSITTLFQGARRLFYLWLISNALQWGCGKVLFFLLPSPLSAHNDGESLMNVSFN